MKVLLVIPARLKSSRLEEKLLLKIQDKEIILWTALRVQQTGFDFIVAIDDECFIGLLDKYEYPWVMTSKNHRSGTERLVEVAEKVPSYERYCIVQGDEPLIHPREIKHFVRHGMLVDCDYVQAITKFSYGENPADSSNVKAVISKSGKLIFATRSLVPFEFDQKKSMFSQNQIFQISGLYLFTKSFLQSYKSLEISKFAEIERVEQLTSIYNEVIIQTIQISDPMFSVDTPEDYERILLNWTNYTRDFNLNNK